MGGNLGVDVTFTRDPEECSQICRDTSGCKSFTFAKAWKGCYLKQFAKPGRRESDCCISGLPACGGSSAVPSPAPDSTTEAAKTSILSSSSTVAPVVADDAFVLHEGVNCWKDHGAAILPEKDMIGVKTLSECKSECESQAACTGIVVFHDKNPGNCWLRTHINLTSCQENTPWDLWLKA